MHCLASSNCCIREYTTTPHKMDILNASGQVVATYTYGTTSSSPDGSGGTNAKFTDAKKVQ